MREIVSIGFWASVAIIAMVSALLLLNPTTTGSYIADGTYIQYEPREACEIRDCIFDLELQTQLPRNPNHEPKVGCYCGGQVTYFPLIERI